MNRPLFAGVATLLLVGFVVTTRASANEQPNIIILFADDLGYGELEL